MEIQYIRVGDYYLPDLMLPEESRPMGKWGRMHRDYLKENKPIQYQGRFCRTVSGIERNAATGNGLDYQPCLHPMPGS